jgi:hypothetical protein
LAAGNVHINEFVEIIAEKYKKRLINMWIQHLPPGIIGIIIGSCFQEVSQKCLKL